MLTVTQWTYLTAILLVAFAGGYLPLRHPNRLHAVRGFPRGEAFACGVFLALSLTMMLPASFQIFRQALPEVDYPVASVIAIGAFLVLLAMEHLTRHVIDEGQSTAPGELRAAAVPMIATVMIAVPSFFLGTALGMSETAASATLIFLAVILHKGTAAFALALSMTRSTLSHRQAWILFTCFVFTTPIGILVGGAIHQGMNGKAMLIKATALALGAGTFLSMGTLHEMKRSSLIHHCCKPGCFFALLAGLVITALVRLVVGEAHLQ